MYWLRIEEYVPVTIQLQVEEAREDDAYSKARQRPEQTHHHVKVRDQVCDEDEQSDQPDK